MRIAGSSCVDVFIIEVKAWNDEKEGKIWTELRFHVPLHRLWTMSIVLYRRQHQKALVFRSQVRKLAFTRQKATVLFGGIVHFVAYPFLHHWHWSLTLSRKLLSFVLTGGHFTDLCFYLVVATKRYCDRLGAFPWFFLRALVWMGFVRVMFGIPTRVTSRQYSIMLFKFWLRDFIWKIIEWVIELRLAGLPRSEL